MAGTLAMPGDAVGRIILTVQANLAALGEIARRTGDAAPLYRFAISALNASDSSSAAIACRMAFAIEQTALGLRAMLRGEPDRLVPASVTLERARSLVAGGFTASTMLAELTVAAALAGDDEQVRVLIDNARLVHAGALSAAGQRSPGAPPADIAAIVGAGKRFVEQGPGRAALRNAWRYDNVSEDSDEPVVRGLLGSIRSAVDRYIRELCDDPGHPFLAGKPRAYRLNGWGVVSGAQGHHGAHVHHRAWATCIYYVAVPDAIANEQERRGWLRLGAPDAVPASARRGWEERWVQPFRDLLVIMPGYFHHETRPTLVAEERICIAVDVIPA